MNAAPKRGVALPLAMLAAAALVAAALAAFPLSLTCALPDGSAVQGWVSPALRALHLPLLLAAAAFSWSVWRLSARLPAGSVPAAARPLAWLPLVVLGSTAAPWTGRIAASLVLPLGGCLVAADLARRLLEADAFRRLSEWRPRLVPLAVFAATALLLLLVWRGHAAGARFRGSGDVGHYRLQMENLLTRGDLDLTDYIEAEMEARGVQNRTRYLRQSHMLVNEDGRIHSYHSFGFPVLAAVFVRLLGSFGETLLKVLIGAFALVGCRSACLAAGARRPEANVVTALLGLSFVWVYDALAFLPEMLGFALCAWAAWGAFAQSEPRWRAAATAAAAVSCAYLPYAHIRFAPMALALFGTFGIEGLCAAGEPFWRRKAPRLALFTIACGAAWLALFAIHRSFYGGGGAYDYGNIALRQPAVMWWILADRRGLAAAFPAILPLFAAPWCSMARGGAEARRAVLSALVCLSVLLSCCCTEAALGGACLPGRYLFPAVPALLPFLALALGRTDRGGRLWLLFLLVAPVLYFVFLSFSIVGSSLLRVPTAMRAFPLLQSWWEPMAYHRTGSAAVHLAGFAFTGSLLLLSLLACIPLRGKLRAASAAALLAAAFFAGAFVDRNDPPERGTAFEALQSDRRMHAWRLLEGTPADLFAAFREKSPPEHPEWIKPPLAISSEPVENPRAWHRSAAPDDLPADDAIGPGLRWAPVRSSPIRTRGRPGGVALRVRGRVESGRARLALVRGGTAANPGGLELPEGPFDVVFRTRTDAETEWVDPYVALEDGRGAVFVDSFEFAPWPKGFDEAFPSSPEGAVVFDFTE